MEILLSFLFVCLVGGFMISLGAMAALLHLYAQGIPIEPGGWTAWTLFYTFLLTLGIMLSGCAAPRPPCLTGFEVGVNGGKNESRWRGSDSPTNGRDEYVGAHATAFFDTTGACGVTGE